MVKFLKVIGTPFIKLWTWIKETAWVQPLLIVGIIFAVIFSIPSITSWVQSWDFGSDSYTFLKDRQLSLEGITDKSTEGEAYNFFSAFDEAQESWANGDKEGARESLHEYVGDSNKMLVLFVQEDDTAENVNEALNYLVNDGWNRVTSLDKTAPSLQLRTIFTDQTVEVDKGDTTYRDHTPFDYLFTLSYYERFCYQAAEVATHCPYYRNKVSDADQSTISSIETSAENITSYDSFSTAVPYYVIIDLTDTNQTNYIISNTFFTVDGEDRFERADFFAQAWTNQEDFEL